MTFKIDKICPRPVEFSLRFPKSDRLLAGLLLPLVPGAPLLFLGLLLAAWAEGFRYIGVWTLLLLATLAALTHVVEFVASIMGVKKYGGSRRAMLGAAVGGVVGIFLGIPGVLLGPSPGYGDRTTEG